MKWKLGLGFIFCILSVSADELLTNDIYSDIIKNATTEKSFSDETTTFTEETNLATLFDSSTTTDPTAFTENLQFDDIQDNFYIEPIIEHFEDLPFTIPPVRVPGEDDDNSDLTEKRSVLFKDDESITFEEKVDNKSSDDKGDQQEFRLMEDSLPTSSDLIRTLTSDLFVYFTTKLKEIEDNLVAKLTDLETEVIHMKTTIGENGQSLKNIEYDLDNIKHMIDDNKNNNRETTRYLYTTAQLVRGDLHIFLENINRTEEQLNKIHQETKILNSHIHNESLVLNLNGMNKVQSDISVIASKCEFTANQCQELLNGFESASRIITGEMPRKFSEITEDLKSGILWLASKVNSSSTMLSDRIFMQESALQQVESTFRSESEWINRFLAVTLQSHENLTLEISMLRGINDEKAVTTKDTFETLSNKVDGIISDLKNYVALQDNDKEHCSDMRNISNVLNHLGQGLTHLTDFGNMIYSDLKNFKAEISSLHPNNDESQAASVFLAQTRSLAEHFTESLKNALINGSFELTEIKHEVNYIKDLLVNSNEATHIQIQRIVSLFSAMNRLLESYESNMNNKEGHLIHPIVSKVNLKEPEPIKIDGDMDINKNLVQVHATPKDLTEINLKTSASSQVRSVAAPPPNDLKADPNMYKMIDKMKFEIIDIILCLEGKLPVDKVKDRMKPGVRVVPGRDWNPSWKYDGGGEGIISAPVDEDGHVRVKWQKTGDERVFSMGYLGRYHLRLAKSECEPRSSVVKFT
ncbi:hypothetical protein QYM36_014438 [Artemia franciscana]|uniref:Uncharacterized protein n=1 Tax=Artemia franciscana TaxID=6661 RepID=A0AA88HQ69_ARTSF|nr:hypothetical protein QYM36_014438 [Artemia franciscana]